MTLKLIEKSCGRYMESYFRCTRKFPDTYHIDCNTQAQKLQKCSNSHPTITKIKSACADELSLYSACVDENHHLSQKKCSQEFKKFSTCADRVTESISGKKNV